MLVEREIQGWVEIEADTQEEAEAATYKLTDDEIPHAGNGRVRQHVWRSFSLGPRRTAFGGRTLVINHREVGYGYGKRIEVTLDCGHEHRLKLEQWNPASPYMECTSCQAEIDRGIK